MNKKYSDLELLNMKQSNKIYSIDEIKEILKDTFKKFDIFINISKSHSLLLFSQ